MRAIFVAQTWDNKNAELRSSIFKGVRKGGGKRKSKGGNPRDPMVKGCLSLLNYCLFSDIDTVPK